ncbi:hypothetical protein LguiB_035120 [Lonicera macranthoides]
MGTNFFTATSLLRELVEKLLELLEPWPNCLIFDMCFPWTNDVAQKFHIPRLVFQGQCCFALLCTHNLVANRMFDDTALDSKPFLVPDLPDQIELTKAQLPNMINQKLYESEEFERWILEEGFEDRIRGRVESVYADMPMMTWPNKRLVIQVIRIEERSGVDVTLMFGKEEKIGVLVKKDEVKMVLEKLMDEGNEGRERRKIVKELGEMAKRAIEKAGSSQVNITLLDQDIMQLANK